MEEGAFCFYWNRHLEYEFAFPEFKASVKSTICGLAECFLNHHVILQSIPSDQGSHFTAKEVQQ